MAYKGFYTGQQVDSVLGKVLETTATSTELNYCSGVTSNIQTQLNSKITKNTDITGATYTKITYDSKGLVTGGEILASSDIPDLSLTKITDVTATASEVNVLDGITATTTELNYCDGVTSNIQVQLDSKQATITGAASSVVSSNLTPLKVLVADADGKISVSEVTAEQLVALVSSI